MFAAGFEDELDINMKYYVLKADSSCGGLNPVTADRVLKTTKVESRLEEDGIQWVQVLGGYLSARPIPGGTSILKAWKCTALVSLIKDASSAMGDAAQELDLKWIHAPIEPIANSRKGISVLDRESFLKVDEVASLLKVGERVVVHCQAGCHRTGIFCYVLLRRLGFSPENAMSAIRSTRERTWEEIVVVTKKRPNGLQPKAERIFGEIFTAMRAVSAPQMPASAPLADLVANAMSPAPAAEPTPTKSNEELSAMTKEERTAYHKYRRAAIAAAKAAGGPTEAGPSKAKCRAKQAAERKVKEDARAAVDVDREALEELKLAGLAEEHAREVLMQLAKADLEKGEDSDDEDACLLTDVRKWMSEQDVAVTDFDSVRDLNLKVRFQGHVDSTPPDHLGAILNVLSSKAFVDCKFERAKKPNAVAKKVEAEVERWSFVLNALYQKCDALAAADIVVTCVREGILSVSGEASEATTDNALVGFLMALRAEVGAIDDHDLLTGCRRLSSETKVLKAFMSHLEDEIADDDDDSD